MTPLKNEEGDIEIFVWDVLEYISCIKKNYNGKRYIQLSTRTWIKRESIQYVEITDGLQKFLNMIKNDQRQLHMRVPDPSKDTYDFYNLQINLPCVRRRQEANYFFMTFNNTTKVFQVSFGDLLSRLLGIQDMTVVEFNTIAENHKGYITQPSSKSGRNDIIIGISGDVGDECIVIFYDNGLTFAGAWYLWLLSKIDTKINDKDGILNPTVWMLALEVVNKELVRKDLSDDTSAVVLDPQTKNPTDQKIAFWDILNYADYSEFNHNIGTFRDTYDPTNSIMIQRSDKLDVFFKKIRTNEESLIKEIDIKGSNLQEFVNHHFKYRFDTTSSPEKYPFPIALKDNFTSGKLKSLQQSLKAFKGSLV